jgi:hypothetical protein
VAAYRLKAAFYRDPLWAKKQSLIIIALKEMHAFCGNSQ